MTDSEIRKQLDDERLLTELMLLRLQFERGIAVQSYQDLISRAYSRIMELRREVARSRQ